MLWLKPQAVREKRRRVGRRRGWGYLPRVRMRMRRSARDEDGSLKGPGQMIMVVYVLRLGVARIRFLLTMQSYGKIPDPTISDVRQMQGICAVGILLGTYASAHTSHS